MGRKFQYTTLDRILSKLYRDLGLDEISETDVVEWTGEALEAIGVVSLLEQKVNIIDVIDHHADLPGGLHSIVQIAKNNAVQSTVELIIEANEAEPAEQAPSTCLIAFNQNIDITGYPVPLDQNGTPMIDFDVAYYRPFTNIRSEFISWDDSGYTPVRLANHTFFNTLVCEENPDIYTNSVDEYTIVPGRIRTSFKNGVIAVAYYRQKLDETTGYPMIPDDISVITAITSYITMKYMARLWYLGREGYGDKVKKAEADWQWYCAQSSNSLFAFYGLDEHQNMLEQRKSLIPNDKKYFGFFGNLSRGENKSYFNSMRHGQ